MHGIKSGGRDGTYLRGRSCPCFDPWPARAGGHHLLQSAVQMHSWQASPAVGGTWAGPGGVRRDVRRDARGEMLPNLAAGVAMEKVRRGVPPPAGTLVRDSTAFGGAALRAASIAATSYRPTNAHASGGHSARRWGCQSVFLNDDCICVICPDDGHSPHVTIIPPFSHLYTSDARLQLQCGN